MSLSGITHHSHLFTRLKIYHHIYFNYYIVDILIKSPVRVICNHFHLSLSGLGAAVGVIKVGHKKLFLLVSNVTNTYINEL